MCNTRGNLWSVLISCFRQDFMQLCTNTQQYNEDGSLIFEVRILLKILVSCKTMSWPNFLGFDCSAVCVHQCKGAAWAGSGFRRGGGRIVFTSLLKFEYLVICIFGYLHVWIFDIWMLGCLDIRIFEKRRKNCNHKLFVITIYIMQCNAIYMNWSNEQTAK